MQIIKNCIINFYKTLKLSLRKTKIYYKDQPSKSKFKILTELFLWLIKEKSHNQMFYAFGLNILGNQSKLYIGRKGVLYYKYNAEKKLKGESNKNLNYDIITKDKFYANSILLANNIKCVKNIALISNQNIIYNDGTEKNIEDIFKIQGKFILKDTILEAGEGLLVCKNLSSLISVNGKKTLHKEFIEKLMSRKWVLQTFEESHPQIAKINNTALNTTRIVTIMHKSTPTYLTGFQAFATNKENSDGWDKGAIYVGINIKNNCLKKYGYYHPMIGNTGCITQHPNSKITFENYKISELNKAVNLCLKAHKLFYFNFIIGWDVAITNQGPKILEINEEPGMNAVQCVDGGLRKKIKTYYNKIN